jgi:hypothetical protein
MQMLLLSDFEDLLTFKGWNLTWQMKIESTLFYLMSAQARGRAGSLKHSPIADTAASIDVHGHTAENSRNYTTHFSIDFARVSEKQRR